MEHRIMPGVPEAGETAARVAASPAGPLVPVVGLDASAGGLRALQTFFDHTLSDTGMAFVVILHLAPDYELQAAALLQQHTAMPVVQVTDAAPLVPNHVYVIPPGRHLWMVDGHVRLEVLPTEPAVGEAPARDATVCQPEAQIERAREHLQLTVEAYETSGEEYKAANEALTAANDDLTTVDQALRHEVAATSRANNDLVDITDRERVEEHLRASEERYRTLFESIDEGFCVVEVLFDDTDAPIDYRFLEINPAFERQTGLVDAVGKRIRELRPTLEAHWFEIYGEVARTGNAVRFENWAEALHRWYDVYAFRVGQPDDRLVAILFNDITERKRAEAERERLLQEAEQARQEAEAALQARAQFLSIASHELRTPLTSLLGYATMLQSHVDGKTGTEATLRRQAAIVARQANRLNALIGQMLDVSRLERGLFTMERQPLDIDALVAQVVEEFRLTLPHGDRHTITLLRPDEPLPVLADAARLEEVIHNLLTNAVKYSPAGGRVEVRVGREAAEVVLEVVDQGIGVPAEAQPHLFEPFYRAENVSPESSGFGIGLYVAYEIVQRHGGRIEVASAPGAGSRFRVVLPRLAQGS